MAIDERNVFREQTIADYKSQGYIKEIEILANKGACDACKARGGSIISLDDIDKTPLPTTGCTHSSGCRCAILPVIE